MSFKIIKKFKDIQYPIYEKWPEKCMWKKGIADKSMEKKLRPKIVKYLDELQDKITDNDYTGSYDFEETKRRRLYGAAYKKPKTNFSIRGRLTMLPDDADYWTQLAMKKSHLLSTNKGKALVMAQPSMIEMQPQSMRNRRMETKGVETHNNSVIMNKIEKAQGTNQRSHNVKLDLHKDGFRTDAVSKDGLTTETRLGANAVSTRSESLEEHKKLMKGSKKININLDENEVVVKDSEELRNLRGDKDIQWAQDDNADYDMTKVYGANKFVQATIKAKDLDELANVDPQKLIKDAMEIVTNDDSSSSGKMVEAMALIGCLILFLQ